VPDLGHLTWYTIYDQTLDRDTLLARLADCGLDAFAPAPIDPADAFRRATHQLERLRVPQADGTAVNWLVREVRRTDTTIVRHLVRETVDAQRVRLDYRAVLGLVLERSTGAFVTTVLDAAARPEEQAAADAARSAYDTLRHSYQGRHLRELALRVLRTLNPVAVRPSGGVYFVPAAGTATLRRLQAFLQTCPPSQCWALPVADTGDARQVLSAALDDTVRDTGARVVQELAELLARRGRLTDAERVHAADAFRRLHTLVQTYQALLDDRLLAAQTTLQAAEAQLRALLAAPEVPA